MITYEVMVAATMGDPVAAEEVLKYFDGYIDHLCTHPFIAVSYTHLTLPTT